MPARIAERKRRWTAFLNREPDAPRHLFIIRVPDPEADVPDFGYRIHWPGHAQERIEWAWKHYQAMFARLDWLHDDAIPHLNMITGTEIFAEAFGCEIERPEDNMPFAKPIVFNVEQAEAIDTPRLRESTLMRQFEVADTLRDRAGDDALLRMVDVQSPMDIAALIWEKAEMLMAMIDAPDAVARLAAKVRALLVAFLDEWFDRYDTDFIAHYPDYYMPRGITLSEDEVGAVNTEMFESLFLPELNELSQRYGGLGMHCCADSMHQWAAFKKIKNLRLLNLVRPDEQYPEAFATFAGHVPQFHNWRGEGAPWTWPDQLPEGVRAVFEINAESKNDAIEIATKMREVVG